MHHIDNETIMRSKSFSLRELLSSSLLLLFSVVVVLVAAEPYRFIMSAKPLCASTSIVPGIKYQIFYRVPDIDRNVDDDMVLEVRHSDDSNSYRQRDLVISTHSLRDIDGSVTVNVKSNHEASDGFVDVCVKALMATRQRPRRVFLDVQETAPPKYVAPDQSHLVDRLARMEYEVERMATEVENLMRMSEMSREQSYLLHQKNRKMHRASKWWPILQIIILGAATFMQARYMMGYLSKRHVF